MCSSDCNIIYRQSIRKLFVTKMAFPMFVSFVIGIGYLVAKCDNALIVGGFILSGSVFFLAVPLLQYFYITLSDDAIIFHNPYLFIKKRYALSEIDRLRVWLPLPSQSGYITIHTRYGKRRSFSVGLVNDGHFSDLVKKLQAEDIIIETVFPHYSYQYDVRLTETELAVIENPLGTPIKVYQRREIDDFSFENNYFGWRLMKIRMKKQVEIYRMMISKQRAKILENSFKQKQP